MSRLILPLVLLVTGGAAALLFARNNAEGPRVSRPSEPMIDVRPGPTLQGATPGETRCQSMEVIIREVRERAPHDSDALSRVLAEQPAECRPVLARELALALKLATPPRLEVVLELLGHLCDQASLTTVLRTLAEDQSDVGAKSFEHLASVWTSRCPESVPLGWLLRDVATRSPAWAAAVLRAFCRGATIDGAPDQWQIARLLLSDGDPVLRDCGRARLREIIAASANSGLSLQEVLQSHPTGASASDRAAVAVALASLTSDPQPNMLMEFIRGLPPQAEALEFTRALPSIAAHTSDSLVLFALVGAASSLWAEYALGTRPDLGMTVPDLESWLLSMWQEELAANGRFLNSQVLVALANIGTAEVYLATARRAMSSGDEHLMRSAVDFLWTLHHRVVLTWQAGSPETALLESALTATAPASVRVAAASTISRGRIRELAQALTDAAATEVDQRVLKEYAVALERLGVDSPR